MKNQVKRMYAQIAKVEAQEDGTLMVSGFASTGAVDSDGETVTPDAMKAALPDYMKFGAVREMHQASAAGTATRAEVNAEGQTEFEAHVVDPIAVKKVQTGVYKGFSIGGKVTDRDPADKKIIKGLRLVEVSLVDRPANPEAVISIFKAERTAEDDVGELAEMLDDGSITPAQVLALVKAAKDAPTEPAPAPIKKGMWSVQDFAGILSSLGWICRDAQDEAAYEGDSSPVPAALRAWLAQGIDIFQAMAAEETAELIAGLKTAAGDVDVLTMAQRGAGLAKAGAKFSTATKAALAEVHKSMKDCCDKMAGLGYDAKDDDDDSAALAAQVGELQKAAGTAADDLTKARAAHADEITKLSAEADTLRKRVTELEAMPAPGRALLKALGKGEDVATATGAITIEPITDAKGEINEAATLIKAAHRLGGHRSTT